MRSPQLSALVRASEQFHEERSSSTFSRRALLGGAGALAGAAVLSGPAHAGGRLAQPRVAIIGGGISGLAAALELNDAGIVSTVYEAQDRFGGRMYSNTSTWLDGQSSEWGGEFIDTGHKVMQSLSRRFGLTLVDVLQAQPPGSEDTRWLRGDYYSSSQFASDFSPVYKTLKDQVQAIGSGFSYDSLTPMGRTIDAMSLASWIDAVHRRTLGSRQWFDPHRPALPEHLGEQPWQAGKVRNSERLHRWHERGLLCGSERTLRRRLGFIHRRHLRSAVPRPARSGHAGRLCALERASYPLDPLERPQLPWELHLLPGWPSCSVRRI